VDDAAAARGRPTWLGCLQHPNTAGSVAFTVRTQVRAAAMGAVAEPHNTPHNTVR
jgi:hypothetical protein